MVGEDGFEPSKRRRNRFTGKVIIFHVVLFTGVGDSDKIKMSEYVKRGHCIAEIIRETEIGE